MAACSKPPAGTALTAGILIRLPVLTVEGLGQSLGRTPFTHPFVPQEEQGMGHLISLQRLPQKADNPFLTQDIFKKHHILNNRSEK
jgi:hypothetical protein